MSATTRRWSIYIVRRFKNDTERLEKLFRTPHTEDRVANHEFAPCQLVWQAKFAQLIATHAFLDVTPAGLPAGEQVFGLRTRKRLFVASTTPSF